MFDTRGSGILLHPTSFPGRGGIGELGPAAYRFVDWLHAAGQQFWQILPLGPTGYGDSPYASFSAFAGNPLLISLKVLANEGLVDAQALDSAPHFNEDSVEYGPVIEWKSALLRSAYETFVRRRPADLTGEWQAFCREEARWLDDYALFRALKNEHGGGAWNTWPREFVRPDASTLAQARERLADAIDLERFLQFLFFRQWRALKTYANERGIRIIGDVPIFVAYDSADVWAHPELFQLDENGDPTVVAGVPPDYFSATGQLWGNPHYRWDVLAQQGYHWWIDRIRTTLSTVDALRIDHFRGFEAAWAVPAGDETAERGEWVPGPGLAVFYAIRGALGQLPIIAEDLGVITPEVEAIRDDLGLPGMKILQFAWSDDATNKDLPHNYTRHFVVYSGTHDNDTTVGWFNTRGPEERFFALTYTGTNGSDIAWDFIRLAFTSVANTAVVPLQDVMSLGTEARMNLPGRAHGNWGWRYRDWMLTEALAHGLRNLAIATGRMIVTSETLETKEALT
ncbi:MAG: 4-alpha-glucanotransferase [Chloroflexota bacterium]|nr:4-alpha-glucanotransferase [Chloroflexota bacterium]